MTSRFHIRPHLVIVAVALLVLVPLLAVLQYRWIGQISGQERDRMQATLQTAVFHFARNVNEEFTTLLRTLGPAMRGPATDPAFEMAMRLQEWETLTSHPNLIERIAYIHQDEDSVRTWLFDGIQFKPSSIPVDSLVTGEPSRDPLDWKRILIERDYAVYLNTELRAVVLPLGADSAAPVAQNCIVILLDRTYIRERMIPAMATTTLWTGESHDFEFSITGRGDPAPVLFTSRPDGAVIAPGDADVRMGILMFPPFPLSMAPSSRGQRGPDRMDRRPDEWRRPPEGEREGDSTRFDRPGRRPEIGRDPRGDDAALEIRIRHRAGSLEAAVNQSRIRNLAISSGILVLMVVALGVLLVSSHRMQQLADRQISFVAGMSHELRTPLAVLNSAGENLADGVVSDPLRVKAYGHLIRSEVQRLSVLAENALGYAGIHAGKRQYTLGPVLLNDVVTKALSACQPMLMEAGMSADMDLPPDPPVVQADASALGTAVQNLISNAVKYSGTADRIRIVVHTDGTSGNEGIAIDVEDHGLGIDAGEIKHIFEPFYRTEDVRTRQIRGTGLGLNLALHVVRAHGGTITVRSAPGKGSCFTIHLPFQTSDRMNA